MAKDSAAETFDQIYSRLEQTVAKLEEGGMPLEQAIALYEEGMTLARQCQERLDDAELKITKLKESFASLPSRNNGATLNDSAAADYEYVAGDDAAPEDEPFP